MPIVPPPDDMFLVPPRPLHETQGAATLNGWERVEHPKEGGMLSYYTDHPFPFKGQPVAEATEANNIIKKLTLGILVSLIPRLNWLEKILYHYCRLADYTNRNYYLQREYYKLFGSEVWNFVFMFFRRWGISFDLSYRLGRIAANWFEWDDAYRYRPQDVMSESSKELWQNPRKESKRLLGIYLKREKLINGEEDGLDNKAKRFIQLLSLLLLIPKVKKCFLFALDHADFKRFQFDKTDRYWCNQFEDYDYYGEDRETRLAKFINDQNLHIFNKELLGMAEKSNNPETIKKIKEIIKQQYV